MTVKFHFGVPFQRSLLRLCMIDEGFNHRVMEYIDPSYFTTEPLGWIFKAMNEYYTTYSQRCTDLPLREMVKRAKPENAARYAEEVERVIQLSRVVEDGFIKSQLQDFIQRNMFAQMHKDAAQYYNEGKIIDAYDLTQRTMDQIRTVSFDQVDRSWFFEDFDKRQRERHLKTLDPTRDVITTGIAELDRTLEGGAHVGELYFMLAYPKVGKTTWLVDKGFVGIRAERAPVLHINLEGHRSQVENKYDARFSNELYSEVKKGEINPSAYRELIAEYQMLRGLLVIRSINEWNTNILHIDAELKELKSHGFVPRLIILDYVDLLRSRDRVSSEMEHQISAAKDTKQLANKGYAVWSACQAQRPRKNADDKEHVIKGNDIADAYGKVRIADGWGSLNATNEEKKRDELRLYWEEWRDGPAGLYLRLFNERNRMRLAKRVERIAHTTKKEDD